MFIPAGDDSKKALRSSYKKRRTSKALRWVFLLYAHDAEIEVPLSFLCKHTCLTRFLLCFCAECASSLQDAVYGSVMQPQSSMNKSIN